MHSKRKSLRLQGYDYTQYNFYFVTVCVKDRQNRFGEIRNGEMMSNDAGRMVDESWQEIPKRFGNCRLDVYVIMPNHIHGIIEINNNVEAGSPGPNPEGGETPPLRIESLSDMMGYFKYQSTKRINVLLNSQGRSVWQRSFHDHIIRNEQALNHIREYVQTNPARWSEDAFDKD